MLLGILLEGTEGGHQVHPHARRPAFCLHEVQAQPKPVPRDRGQRSAWRLAVGAGKVRPRRRGSAVGQGSVCLGASSA